MQRFVYFIVIHTSSEKIPRDEAFWASVYKAQANAELLLYKFSCTAVKSQTTII